MVTLDIETWMDLAMPIAPHLILILTALIVPAIGMKSGKAAAVFSIMMGFVAMAVTGYMMNEVLNNGTIYNFEGHYAFDAFTGLMILIFLTVFILVSLMSVKGSETKRFRGEYFSLLAGATVGMMLVSASENLVSLFVGIELASLLSIALVAFKKNDPRSSEAAVKYLITGGLSTALFLYGMSLVYGLTGSLELSTVIAELAKPQDLSVTYMIATVTLIAGLAFKISAVPFHAWAPDVYEGAPTAVTTFLAVGSKKMGFVVFFKIFLLMFIIVQDAGRIHELQWIFAMLAAATMTLGNVVAISQKSIKRMLAYSSIAQGGYLLIVLSVASEYAAMGGLFYMIVHIFMKGGAFAVVAALAARGLGENISDYRGLSKRAPLVAFAMLLFMFSLAGIPPLAGFAAKFILFSSAVTSDGTWIWLVALAVINSAISLYYYARVVKTMYVDKDADAARIKVHWPFKIAIALCAVAVVVIGLYPGPVLEFCEAAASQLIGS